MSELIQAIFNGVIEGDQKSVETNVIDALESGLEPAKILNDGMIAAMSEVGRLFEEGEYFVPEMLIAARAMQTGLVILKPKLIEADIEPIGTVAIGTVKGDLHDIGKNLVAMMLEGAGFAIRDLGTDVAPEDFVAIIQSEQVDIVALSALLTTTMPSMKTTIEALEEAGIRNQVIVMIGGAPVTEDYARQINADGFSSNASSAVRLAKSLLRI